jgi:hypothetical protein
MKTIRNQNKNGRPKKDEADGKKYKLTVKSVCFYINQYIPNNSI